MFRPLSPHRLYQAAQAVEGISAQSCFRSTMIDDGPVCGAQGRVRIIGRTWNLEEMPIGVTIHPRYPSGLNNTCAFAFNKGTSLVIDFSMFLLRP
jgi:hypothetical protein